MKHPLIPKNYENLQTQPALLKDVAQVIALHVLDILKRKIILPSTQKAIEAKDIMILVQKKLNCLMML